MSLVVARITGANICIVSNTKLSPADQESSGIKQHPRDGVIKTTILNIQQCVSFAGSIYFAGKAFKEIEQGGNIEEIKEILFRYHAFSDFKTQFIFCFFDGGPHLVSFENGQMLESTTAWIGDKEAFEYYQRYYHGDINDFPKSMNKDLETNTTGPNYKNLKITINSKVPNDESSKMAAAIDKVIYYHSLPTVGGFRIQVTYDDGIFSYTRYTSISNLEIDIDPERPGRFRLSNPAKGSCNINCAQGNNNYNYAAIHVQEAGLGVLYIRGLNGILRPRLYSYDLLDFSDYISQYNLEILILDNQRPPKYYQRAKDLFENENYRDAIQWIYRAMSFTPPNKAAHLYYVLGLCFHNYGRPLTARLCFEQATSLDSIYADKLKEHNKRLQ